MNDAFLKQLLNPDKELFLKEQKALLDQFSTLTVFMDLNSQVMLANQSLIDYMGYQKIEDIVGLTIEHSKSNASELAEEFIKQNKNIIVEDKKLSILTCTESAAGEICFYLSPRQPIKNTKDEVVGIAYQGINLMNTTMMNSAIALFRDKKGVLKQGLLTFKSAHDDKYDFNARELDCLAFLLRGFSVKEIANRLKLGVRSVEYYVACMRHKFSVGSKNALIDKAMSLGYFNFVPEHWLSY